MSERVTDAMWRAIEPLLRAHDPARRLGRHRVPQRGVAEALAYRLATGCAWNRLPPELGDDATVHRTVQRWTRLGLYEPIAAILTGPERAGERASEAMRDMRRVGALGLLEGSPS